jgi:flagellin-like protein
MKGVSPVIATVLLIAIAVIGSVAVWYWVSPYTSQPALPQSIVGTGVISTPVTGVYKSGQIGSGATSIDIKNNVGATLSNILYYVYDRVTGLPVGVNGTNPTFQAFVNASTILSGATSNFQIMAYVNTSVVSFPGKAYGVVTDSGNNITVTGYSGTWGSSTMITNKYYSNGTLIWSTPFSVGTGYERGEDLARDANNNLYAFGFGLISITYGDILIKYNGIGAHVWNVSYGMGSAMAQKGRMALDSLNNTYVTLYAGYRYIIKYNSSGNQSWTLDFFQRNPGAVAVDPNNINNVYVVALQIGKGGISTLEKYNSSGSGIWNASLAGYIQDPQDVVVDSVGNITVVGRYGMYPAIVKLASDGTFLWGEYIMDYGQGWSYAVAVDSSNNITTASGCAYGWCIQKYTPTGTRLWNTSFSYPGSGDNAYGVAIDSTNSIIVAGTSGGGANGSIVKYYSNGSYAWPALTAMPSTVPCPGAYTLRSTTSGIADVNFNC